MKYTKSALGMLNSLYRSVLTKCLLINLGLFALAAPAMATVITTTGGRDGLGYAFTSQPTVNVTGLAISDVNELQNKLNDAKAYTDGKLTDGSVDAKFNTIQATEVKVGEGITAVKLSQEADGLCHIRAL